MSADEVPGESLGSPFGDPTRRTYLAAERTLLAWWRTGFAAIAVALAVGRLLPDIAHLQRGPFVVLGVGWGVVACGLLAGGSLRQRRGHRAITSGGYLHLHSGVTAACAVGMVALTVATIAVTFSAT
jgi:putative membrane protein